MQKFNDAWHSWRIFSSCNHLRCLQHIKAWPSRPASVTRGSCFRGLSGCPFISSQLSVARLLYSSIATLKISNRNVLLHWMHSNFVSLLWDAYGLTCNAYFKLGRFGVMAMCNCWIIKSKQKIILQSPIWKWQFFMREKKKRPCNEPDAWWEHGTCEKGTKAKQKCETLFSSTHTFFTFSL